MLKTLTLFLSRFQSQILMLDKDAFDIEKLRISCNKEIFKIKLNNK